MMTILNLLTDQMHEIDTMAFWLMMAEATQH